MLFKNSDSPEEILRLKKGKKKEYRERLGQKNQK